MARMRTLKFGFFRNEVLGSLGPLTRLLFQGLWCIADREGRLEDRPIRIKADVLPYDECDIDDMLEQLAEAGFIVRYEVDGKKYIEITKFKEHQSPHSKEVESTIPPCTVQAPTQVGASTDLGDDEPPFNFNFDSNLFPPYIPPAGGEARASAPDGKSAGREPREPGVGRRPEKYTAEFEAWWSIWAPTIRGRANKPGAYRAWWSTLAKLRKRPEVRSPVEWLEERAKAYVESDTGQSEFAQGPAPWLNQEGYDVPEEKWRRREADGPMGRISNPFR